MSFTVLVVELRELRIFLSVPLENNWYNFLFFSIVYGKKIILNLGNFQIDTLYIFIYIQLCWFWHFSKDFQINQLLSTKVLTGVFQILHIHSYFILLYFLHINYSLKNITSWYVKKQFLLFTIDNIKLPKQFFYVTILFQIFIYKLFVI